LLSLLFWLLLWLLLLLLLLLLHIFFWWFWKMVCALDKRTREGRGFNLGQAVDHCTREYWRGKYHCTIDLLFDWCGISCMTTDNFCFHLQNRLIQTSQTGGQWYSDTSPFSIPWLHNNGSFTLETSVSETVGDSDMWQSPWAARQYLPWPPWTVWQEIELILIAKVSKESDIALRYCRRFYIQTSPL
jgi:hypothetical protein